MVAALLHNFYALIKKLYLIIVTLPRDVRFVLFAIPFLRQFKKFEENRQTVSKVFASWVKKQPQKPCFLFESTVWTFQDVEDYSNKIAHAFSQNYGLKKGDVVALLMENTPEYPCIWLGLSKIGVITALINTNLKTQALVHSILVGKPKILIYSQELSASVAEVKRELDPHVQYVVKGSNSEASHISLETLLSKASSELYISTEDLSSSDVLMYIYTSGTTGLPKPAVIKQIRFICSGPSFSKIGNLTQDDILYLVLPLYHSAGGIIGVSTAFISGVTVCLRRKFSASNFWKDCIAHNCTAFIYIGEICRYLVNQPVSDLEKKHNVRVAIGNGLRANVWYEFVCRFGVKPKEFYAATEGNCTLVNVYGKIGSCGFIPILFSYLPIGPFIIKVDDEMNPVRDANGFCIKCKPGEKGVIVGLIDNERPRKAYCGYANNKKATSKKVINNLFALGQKAFNSGDLMVADEYGWVYFCDRLGDTFRWKGENVSTVEIENIISTQLNSAEVIVYGVTVPGQEGRAGMAAIISKKIDMDQLSEFIKKSLPSYAKPLFIRLTDHVDHTGTFKAQKIKLTDEGFDINRVTDKLFFFDQTVQKYVPITNEVYATIQNQTAQV